jgi:hypothetical protein
MLIGRLRGGGINTGANLPRKGPLQRGVDKRGKLHDIANTKGANGKIKEKLCAW